MRTVPHSEHCSEPLSLGAAIFGVLKDQLYACAAWNHIGNVPHLSADGSLLNHLLPTHGCLRCPAFPRYFCWTDMPESSIRNSTHIVADQECPPTLGNERTVQGDGQFGYPVEMGGLFSAKCAAAFLPRRNTLQRP
jgi:hypothetical protein